MNGKHRILILGLAVAALHSDAWAGGETTAFTFQGQLKRDGVPWNGKADFRFGLWDAASLGNPIGLAVDRLAQTVINGLFTVEVDFGASGFDGNPRWLEVEVRTDQSGLFVRLSPRHPITAAPYALHALNTPSAGLWQANGADIHNTNSGNVGIGDTTPTATLTVGDGDKFQVAGAQGDVTLTDDQASITFAAADATNTPMMHMFASGTLNADRMVLAHSPGAPSWGLQYVDQDDDFVFMRAGTPVLRIDLGGQRVGVGTRIPTEKLEVTGAARADRFLYAAPRQHLLSIPGEAFQPAANVDFFNSGGSGGAELGAGSFEGLVAPVHLPHGAVVTSMRVFYRDTSDHALQVSLKALNYGAGTYEGLASINTVGAPGDADATTMAVSNAVIDNSSRGYFVTARDLSGWDAGNLLVKGVVITYTTIEAD